MRLLEWLDGLQISLYRTAGRGRYAEFSFLHSDGTTTSQASKCPKCDDLQRQYQRTVDEIHSVLRPRFPAVCEKVWQLLKWQDTRDNAIDAFYEHKRARIRRAA